MAGQTYSGLSTAQEAGFDLGVLVQFIQDGTNQATSKLNQIQSAGSNISIGDMFDMQLLMNRLSQMSEMCTSIVNAAHSAVSSMARNVKG